MKRTYKFAEKEGTTQCTLTTGETVSLPIFQGILKHPPAKSLPQLLQKPAVARKYTMLALQKAPWQIIREFPKSWLRACIPDAGLTPSRRKALEFLLNAGKNRRSATGS